MAVILIDLALYADYYPRMFRSVFLSALLAISLGCSGGGGSPSSPPPPPPPPSPTRFQVFPTELAFVGTIQGLGNLNPGGGHVLPVNHMYASFPASELSNTSLTSPNQPHSVVAPAAGTVFLVKHEFVRGHDSYQLFVKVNSTIVYSLDHLTEISLPITSHIAASGAEWFHMNPPSELPRIFHMEMTGRPSGLVVASGDKLGTVRALQDSTGAVTQFSWDFGVMDKDITRIFVNPAPNRYPRFQDSASGLGLTLDYPFLGNPFTNAGRFPDYYDDSAGIRSALLAKVESSPPGELGTDAWDIAGKLRGAWFNSDLDSLPIFQSHEAAAIAIVPSRPDQTRYWISIGNDNGRSPRLAKLDPGGRPELAEPFSGLMVATGNLNRDPALVGVGETVVYELPYNLPSNHGWHTLLCRLTSTTELKVKLVFHDSTDASSAVADLAANPLPDSTWTPYIR